MNYVCVFGNFVDLCLMVPFGLTWPLLVFIWLLRGPMWLCMYTFLPYMHLLYSQNEFSMATRAIYIPYVQRGAQRPNKEPNGFNSAHILGPRKSLWLLEWCQILKKCLEFWWTPCIYLSQHNVFITHLGLMYISLIVLRYCSRLLY